MDKTTKAKKENSPEASDSDIRPEASDPIIFARTKTTHIPQKLLHSSQHQKLRDAIYSAKEDGSLKLTPMDSIEEAEKEEEAKEVEPAPPKKMGFFKRLFYYLCCLCDSIGEEIQLFGGMTDPLVVATSPREQIKQEQAVETPTGPFLGEQSPANAGRKTLVLDLDETLVHSTFQPADECSYVIPVEIEGNVYSVYVYVRPGALEFIRRMSEIYEVIVYTASLQIYADPLLDMMDPDHFISARLFRNHCVCSGGILVKDLGLLGRSLDSVIMIDNSEVSYQYQPMNGIECVPFIDDMTDNELIEMIPFLEYLAKKPDVRLYTKMWKQSREERSIKIFSKGK